MTEFEKYARGHCGISSLKLHDYQSIITNGPGGASVPQPVILESHEIKATAIDVFSRLLIDRIIVLGTPIYEDAANIVMALQMREKSIALEDGVDLPLIRRYIVDDLAVKENLTGSRR